MARYFMKFGILYRENEKKSLARIRGVLAGCGRKILCGGSQSVWRTKICRDGNGEKCVADHHYLMTDDDGNEIVCATPAYAAGSDPDTQGWSFTHLPLVDHARLKVMDGEYLLIMRNRDFFNLSKDENSAPILSLQRCRVLDNWKIESEREFPAQFLCGIISFCQYIRYENELEIV